MEAVAVVTAQVALVVIQVVMDLVEQILLAVAVPAQQPMAAQPVEPVEVQVLLDIMIQ